MPFKIHEYLRNARFVSEGEPQRNPHAPVGLHKEYLRMERIALPAPAPLTVPLEDALALRRSHGASMSSSGALTVPDISTLLSHALGVDKKSKRRRYPSGGALYPVETYLLAHTVEGTRRGAFHYHPSAHALEFLWDLPEDFEIEALSPTSKDASALLLFTGIWDRSSAKYGNFGYYLGMLEAGHMAQNVLLAATALSIGACPIGGFDDELASQILDLNETTEQPVYAIALYGKNVQR